MEDKRFRICWRVISTGYTGKGDPVAEHIARSWLAVFAGECPDMEHWMEPVEEEGAPAPITED